MNRQEVLTEIMQELNLPFAPCCTSQDMQRLILMELDVEDLGGSDCFGYLYDRKDETCIKCDAKDYCVSLFSLPEVKEEAKKWQMPRKPKFDESIISFTPGSKVEMIFKLLQERPMSLSEMRTILVKEHGMKYGSFGRTWDYVLERLAKSGVVPEEIDKEKKIYFLPPEALAKVKVG